MPKKESWTRLFHFCEVIDDRGEVDIFCTIYTHLLLLEANLSLVTRKGGFSGRMEDRGRRVICPNFFPLQFYLLRRALCSWNSFARCESKATFTLLIHPTKCSPQTPSEAHFFPVRWSCRVSYQNCLQTRWQRAYVWSKGALDVFEACLLIMLSLSLQPNLLHDEWCRCGWMQSVAGSVESFVCSECWRGKKSVQLKTLKFLRCFSS